MTTEKLFPSGAWRVSDIIGGHLVQRVYYKYTKRESVSEFKREIQHRKYKAKVEQ